MFAASGIIVLKSMHSFSILNSRKRAIIALVHTVIFLCVAALQTALSHAKAFSLHGDKVVGGIVLLTIYTIVTTVLLVCCGTPPIPASACISRCARPAPAFGLLRILLGDPVLHAGVFRVLLLSGAVVVGTLILRSHSTAPVAEEIDPQ